MKKLIAMLLAIVLVLGMAACASAPKNDAAQTPAKTDDTAAATTDSPTTTEEAPSTENKTYHLKVAGIDGSSTLFPVFVAEEKGWFKDAGLEIERFGFTNGPVTMEAIDTWDISVTGIGGVLSGLISYDAVLLGKIQADDGTQYMFIRPDSDMAAAGTGHNSINDAIVGDADSWRGKSINCAYGTVLHYLLLNTLKGFDLTLDDVTVNWMDIPTSNAAFLAGEGDATCVSGDVSFAPDKAEVVVAANGPLAKLGLQTNFVANHTAIQDPELREAMKIFLRVFFETTDWISANPNDAVPYMIDWCEYAGRTIDEEVAYKNCTTDHYYTLAENYEALTTKAESGDYCQMQEEILNVLKFFIDTESYQQGDDEKFLKDGHFDASLLEELYEESK